MEEQLQFVSDLVPLMKMVKSSSLVLAGFPETWSCEVMVPFFWDSLFAVLIDLKNKNYIFSIEPANNQISIVVRHPDYISF